MTLALWDKSVQFAKIKNKIDPKKFTKIEGELLEEARKIYHILLANNKKK